MKWNFLYCTKLQLPPEPLTRGLPPPDPRSLYSLSSTEFVEPPPKKSWVRHWHRLACFQTRASAVRRQRLTAWPIPRPTVLLGLLYLEYKGTAILWCVRNRQLRRLEFSIIVNMLWCISDFNIQHWAKTTKDEMKLKFSLHLSHRDKATGPDADESSHTSTPCACVAYYGATFTFTAPASKRNT